MRVLLVAEGAREHINRKQHEVQGQVEGDADNTEYTLDTERLARARSNHQLEVDGKRCEGWPSKEVAIICRLIASPPGAKGPARGRTQHRHENRDSSTCFRPCRHHALSTRIGTLADSAQRLGRTAAERKRRQLHHLVSLHDHATTIELQEHRARCR